MLTRHIRSITLILAVALLAPLAGALAATKAPPPPPQFTIPSKERIVLYVADG